MLRLWKHEVKFLLFKGMSFVCSHLRLHLLLQGLVIDTQTLNPKLGICSRIGITLNPKP